VTRAALLADLAARRGHFALESGHHGDLWLDLDALLARPRTVARLATALAPRVGAHRPDVVCGPLTGGAFVAQLIAAELGAGFAWTERAVGSEGVAYRLPAALRAGLRGRTVAVVDDVINAGSASRATLVELRDAGARPVALAALLVLDEGAARVAEAESLALDHLVTLESGRWRPDACPLCAAGAELEDLVPGSPG
jgi:orotate phosphoribosyltransferase